MEWNLTTIIVLLVILFAGYGIGLLENYLKYTGRLKQAEQKSRALQVAMDKTPGLPAVKPVALCVSINPEQTLELEVDGAQVASPQSITPEQRRRLVNLLTQIRPWLEGGPIAPAAQVVERRLALPAAVQPASAAAKPVIEPAPDAGAKSIVGQIDDVLQKLLAGSPLAGRHIMLRETPSGGVLVHVGADHYEGIDAVPEPEIQAIIRRAVAEWEKAQG